MLGGCGAKIARAVSRRINIISEGDKREKYHEINEQRFSRLINSNHKEPPRENKLYSEDEVLQPTHKFFKGKKSTNEQPSSNKVSLKDEKDIQ